MKRLAFGILSLVCTLASAQNLVKNPSIENTGPCPIFFTDFEDMAEPWTNYFGTPDYFHEVCGGPGNPNLNVTDQPFDGNGYAGITVYGDTGSAYVREYLHGELKEPLEEGKFYRVTFYVKPVNDNNVAVSYGINQLGMVLTEEELDSVPDERVYNIEPQVVARNVVVTENYWTAICGIVKARGGERFITIGNFKTDFETSVLPLSGASNPQLSYYLIDQVEVVPNDLPQLPEDTIICTEQRIDLSITRADVSVRWSDGVFEEVSRHYLITEPGIYTATISDPGCSYVDTIVVEPANCDECKVYVPNAFTPDGNGVNDVFEVFAETACEDLISFRISIFDRWGQKVFESNSTEVHWDGLNVDHQGVFTYTMEYEYPLFRETQTLTKRGTITLIK